MIIKVINFLTKAH